MSRKKYSAPTEPEKETAEYYRLHTQAIDELINADKSNSPAVSEEEKRKYGATKKQLLPGWLKILLLKFWFPAAVCFFFLWGLGAYISDLLDMLVIIALALGTVTDILTNNVLRFIAETEGANDKWMMVPKKKFVSLPLNILASGIVLFLIFTFYNAANRFLITVTHASSGSVPLGVEPILFGILYLAFDSLLILMKRAFLGIVADARKKVDSGR